MNAKPILELRSINTFYGKAQILFDLTLSIRQGEAGVLLGRNGVGKSTTLKTIMGLVRAKSGSILFKEKDISGLPPYRICSLGLGYVPQDRRIFTGLTVMQNLEVGRRPPKKGIEPWTPERLFKLFPNLRLLTNRLGGQISGGEQQMLTIARTLMGNPEIILMDEPSEGLAPVILDQLAETIQNIKQRGVTVLLAEQNLYFARRICDRAFIMDHGRICHESSMQELSDSVCEMYLAV